MRSTQIVTVMDLRLWVAERTPALDDDDRDTITEAIRTHPDRPTWGLGWEWFLDSLPELESMLEDDCPEVMITVQVDMEYNAEEFWHRLRREFPDVAESLEKTDEARIYLSEWEAIRALPGFRGGPKHAPTALIEVE